MAKRDDDKKWPDWIGVVPIALAAIFHAREVSARVQDDAFITFRYAKNLLLGHGLVMNPGEKVEGVTSLLFTLLSALGQSLGIDPLSFARAISAGATISVVFSTFFLVRRLAPKSTTTAYVAPALVGGSWAFAVNAMTGLETTLFSALLFAGVALLLVERRLAASFALAAAFLTRPEAAGLYVLLTPVALLPVRRDRREIVRWLLPFVAVAAVTFLFRRGYYGAWVPNTYVAKAGVPLPPSLPTPTSYVEQFFRKEGDLWFAVFGVATLGLVVSPNLRAHAVLGGTVLYGVATVLQNGADFMLGGRYLVPYLPFLYCAAALGADGLLSKTKLSADTKGALAFVAALAFGYHGYRRSADKVRPFEELRRRVTVDAVTGAEEVLRPRLGPRAKVATLDVGELGFRNLDWDLVDISGLTDREIAKTPGDLFDRTFDTDAFLARGIDAVVLISQVPRPMPPAVGNPYWPPGASARLRASMGGFEHAGSFPRYASLVREGGALRPAVSGEEGLAATYHFEVWIKKRSP